MSPTKFEVPPSLTVSDAPTARADLVDARSGPITIEITVCTADNYGHFNVCLGSETIVKSSHQPRCGAARELHRRGFADDALIISRREGSELESMRGPLGVWRRLRVREDKNGPRFASYEPFPRARVLERKAKTRGPPDEEEGLHSDVPSSQPGADAPSKKQGEAPASEALADLTT